MAPANVAGACAIAVVTSVFLNAASRDAEQNRANFIIWACITGVAVVLLLSGGQNASLTAQSAVIVPMTAVYFIGCVAGTVLVQRFKTAWARPLTLTLIIVIAATSLLATYNVSA